MPGNISAAEIAIVLIIALLVFGPKRLPELGRSLGKGIREFKGSITGESDREDDGEDEPKAIASTQPAAPSADQPREAEVARDERG